MDQLAQSALVAAVVGAVVGGLSGFFVARLQRTWDLDARRAEDRKARLRAATDVIFSFLDNIDECRRTTDSPSGPWPLSRPIDRLSSADRWAVASVISIYPDKPTWPGFFYPANYLLQGEVPSVSVSCAELDDVAVFAKRRLVLLTVELERLGDPSLRNLER
jgi:hypothetical protein